MLYKNFAMKKSSRASLSDANQSGSAQRKSKSGSIKDIAVLLFCLVKWKYARAQWAQWAPLLQHCLKTIVRRVLLVSVF
jgi:RNA polymerase-interacting CarD/CdnL/TRCF family regulator